MSSAARKHEINQAPLLVSMSVPERGLVKVLLEILGTHVVVDSDKPPLEE